jgi:ElaB/YqjD/DUF883 family membrane-anchored ribosome-binding protein
MADAPKTSPGTPHPTPPKAHLNDAAASSEDRLNNEVQSLKADLAAIKQDIGGLGSAAYDRGQEFAENVRDQARDQWEQGVDSVQEFCSQKPVTAGLIAVGVGFLLGAYLSRK